MLIYLQMLDTVEARDKFTSIYLIYRDTLYYTAMSILHNQEDAEDAVHQSFLAILQNIDKFPVVESDSVKAYYMTITVHKAIDIIRERQRIVDPAFDEHYIGSVIDEKARGIDIAVPENESPLAIALSKMPAKYRDVLLLHFDAGYTTTELAKMFGMKRATIQKQIWRAKDMLRKYYEEELKI